MDHILLRVPAYYTLHAILALPPATARPAVSDQRRRVAIIKSLLCREARARRKQIYSSLGGAPAHREHIVRTVDHDIPDAAPAAAALSSPGLLLLVLTGTRVVVVVIGAVAIVLVASAVVLALAPRTVAVLLLPGLREWKAKG